MKKGILKRTLAGLAAATMLISGIAASCIPVHATENHTVTFSANGQTATGMPEAQTIADGAKVTRPTADPTATGYKFVDWYATAEAALAATSDGKFNFTATTIEEDTTIYAGWVLGAVYGSPAAPIAVDISALTPEQKASLEWFQNTSGAEEFTTPAMGAFEAPEASDTSSTFTPDTTLLGAGIFYFIPAIPTNTEAQWTPVCPPIRFDVDKKPITPQIAIKDKPYDGTKAAAIDTAGTTLPGILDGDVQAVALSSDVTATFAQAGVGNNLEVHVSNIALAAGTAGNKSSNYIVETPTATVTAAITAAPLKVKAKDASKISGASDPTLEYGVTGLVTGEKAQDILTGAIKRKTGETPGTYAIEQGTLALVLPSNYALTFEPGIFTISKASHSNKTLDEIEVEASSSSTTKKVSLGSNLVSGGSISSSSTSGDLSISVGSLSGSTVSFTIKNPSAGQTGKAVLTIASDDYENYTITVPFKVTGSSDKKSSTSFSNGSGFTSSTGATSNGLDAVAKKIGEDLKLSVTPKSSSNTESGVRDRLLASMKASFAAFKESDVKVEFYDISIIKSSGGTLADTETPIEIALSMTLTDKDNIAVFRDHGGTVAKLTELTSRPTSSYSDGSFYADKTNGKLYIYSRYFSDYVVAYTSTSAAQSGSTSTTGSSPKTGDDSIPIYVWVIFILIGIGIIVFVIKITSKSQDSIEEDTLESNDDVEISDEDISNIEE